MGSGKNDLDPVFTDPNAVVGNNVAVNECGSATDGLICNKSVEGDESNKVNNTDEVATTAHNVAYVYRQDVVRHKETDVIGIVDEVAGDSDSDSSITDEDEYDEDDEDDGLDVDDGDGDGDGQDDVDGSTNENEHGDKKKTSGHRKKEPLLPDQVRVLWMDETEQIQGINDVKVVDRGFLHGDYVASASNPTGQVGVVVDVNISVDLLASDGSVVKDVSSKDLKRVREFVVGDHVILGPWLGRVDDVMDNVTVLVDDGSICKVLGAEPLRLKPISKSFFEEGDHFPYYPGQRVRASSSSVFKNSRWLSGLFKPNRLEGTVTKVAAGSVFIYWIASAGYGPDSSMAPAEEQNPKNLKLLASFAHANWQVGDWCLVPPTVLKSASISLDSELSNFGLCDPMKDNLVSRQLGNDCDPEEVGLDELDENRESTSIDPEVAPIGNKVKIRGKDCHESNSCSSSASVSKEPVHETWPLHRKKIRKVVIRKEKKPRKKEENYERALLIYNTRTSVDVAWQDGTVERGLESTKLIPIDSPGDHEFVSEQYVVEKASDDTDNSSEVRRVGVVKSVNAKERTACVKWLKPVVRAEDPREFDREEIVSVYELEGHADYDYSYGDVVVRLSPVSVSAQTNPDQEYFQEPKKPNLMDDDEATTNVPLCKNSEDAPGEEASMDCSELSWVGNITGLINGDIEVTWADGMVSTVGPQAIFVVGRDEDDESIAVGSDLSDDAASWETVNDDEDDDDDDMDAPGELLQNATGVNSEVDANLENNSGSRSPAVSLSLAAFGFVTRLATGIFSRGRKHSDADLSDNGSESESQRMISVTEERDHVDISGSQNSNTFDPESPHGEEEANGVIEVAASSGDAQPSDMLKVDNSNTSLLVQDATSTFKRFDSTKDPLDHYYVGSVGQISNSRKWLRKVQQDWNILQNNLPDGIYVRVYEDRMDLLRAVIVGAYGTPYQDGLFFFDFHLPPEYPDVPPSAYYHSGGWRINPNLYEEGKVCLSLLNTWTGRGNEVWDPTSSSILQVLVSLQGLVLNSRPYFNEAGYDKQVGTAEGEKNSLSYNENTFLLNCKTMMYLMRRPPKDFEELVKEHFKKRGAYILKACDAYMKGSLIGSLKLDASASNDDSSNLTSVGFKLMLTKIVPKLYTSLNEVGADCQEYNHLLQQL
ncbi:Probable ubiquitin-conjugating enzyme E2 23 [Linum perenne]